MKLKKKEIQLYLFDAIVVETKKFDYKFDYFTRTILTLESELSGTTLKDIVDDFQKLLVSNSEYKVMVFKCHSSEFDEWTKFLKDNINIYYKPKIGIYYLVAYLTDKLKFEILELT